MALDPSGNVIATGPSFLEPEDEGEEPDLRITKISPQGDFLWVAAYDGGLDEADSGSHLRVDATGNIYVAGSSASRCQWVYDEGREEKRCDTAIVMLKFDPTGQKLWTARYGDGEPFTYFPVGLELDASGNSYVVGSIGAWAATVTLKFEPNGSRIWSTVYSVTNHGWDTPEGIALAPDGGVLVAGSSHFTDTSSDYFVLKYRENLPPGFPEIITPPVDQLVALGSNINFSVVASGATPLRYQWQHSGESIPGATNATLALVRITWAEEGSYSVEVSNTAGTVVSPEARLEVRNPVNFYGEPQQRTVIVGDTVQLEFAAIGLYPIRYQWLFNGNEISGATNSVLRLANLQLDQSGVYTLRATDSISTGISAASRIQVTGLAAKCWESRPPGEASASFDHGGKIAVDAAGQVYTAASLLGVVKYDTKGNELWNTPFAGEVEGIALDAAGNIYVTGFQRGHDDDFLTIKYSADGSQRWVRTYDGPAHDTDRAMGVQVDHAGNIIVTGWAHGFSGGTEGRHQDYVTIKYDTNGNELWRSVYDSPDHRQDLAYALAIDDANNIYVTGQSPAAGTRVWDAATVKYAPNGSQLWVAFYQSPATNAVAVDIKVDGTGNIYVAGAGWGLSSRADGFVAKYDPAGHQLWAATYNAPGNWYDSFSRLVLDPAGNILACGSASRGNSYVYDAVLVKLDPTGQRLWTARYESGFYNSVKDAAVDAAGNAYVLTDVGTSGRNTFATLKYDANGNRLWESRFFEDAHSWPGAIATSPTGDVFVTGATDKETAWNRTRIVTLKYCQTETPGAPVIVQPPQDLNVAAGGSGSFQVTASGQSPLFYRWGFHGFSLQMLQANTAVLTLTNIQATEAGDYIVEVCNDLGCTVSPTARLTVQPVPPVLHSPWKTPQSFGFMLKGSSLFPVVVDTSTDLQHWTVLSTNQIMGGELSLSFPNAASSSSPRFFRARSLLELPEQTQSDD